MNKAITTKRAWLNPRETAMAPNANGPITPENFSVRP